MMREWNEVRQNGEKNDKGGNTYMRLLGIFIVANMFRSLHKLVNFCVGPSSERI